MRKHTDYTDEVEAIDVRAEQDAIALMREHGENYLTIPNGFRPLDIPVQFSLSNSIMSKRVVRLSISQSKSLIAETQSHEFYGLRNMMRGSMAYIYDWIYSHYTRESIEYGKEEINRLKSMTLSGAVSWVNSTINADIAKITDRKRWKEVEDSVGIVTMSQSLAASAGDGDYDEKDKYFFFNAKELRFKSFNNTEQLADYFGKEIMEAIHQNY